MVFDTDTLLDGDPLPLALAAVLAGLAAVLAVAAVAFSLFVFVPAAALGTAAFFVWFHATGRLERVAFRRARRQAATGADPGSGGFGAGPREEWVPPRGGRRRAGPGTGAAAGGSGASAGQRTRQGQRVQSPAGPTPREAREVLGVSKSASAADVKAAYRQKVKETHPDRGGDEAQFKRVNDAYEVLGG